MAGSVVVGGPWQSPAKGPIATAAVVVDIQQAASSLDAFAGTFAITERGLSASVSLRHLRMDVAFRAPQRFRMDVRDLTTYPSRSWTPTNLTYISDGSSTYRSGPTGCPALLPAGGCPPTRTTITRSVGVLGAGARTRGPGVAADDVLVGGWHRRGRRRAASSGRQAVEVQLTFARAQPLFPFLELGWQLAPVLRSGSRGPLARSHELVPVAIFGLPVRRSDETSVGAPLRDTRRGEHFIDPRRAAHLVRSPAAGPSALHRSRLVPAEGDATGGVPRTASDTCR